MATKWGICGAGNIANDFCACLKSLPTSEHQIVAVATGSSKERAEEFAQRFDIPTSYGSYDELVKHPGIDVVYVNMVTALHVEMCLKFINAGIPVLCEKTMATSLEGCEKVLQAAKENNVLFIEAYWSRFFPAYDFIKEQIAAGKIGEITTLHANLCADIFQVPTIRNKKVGGGALLAIGCYPVQAANYFFNAEPERVWSEGNICPENGIDTDGVIVLTYKGGRHAILHYSVQEQYGCSDLVIRGTKGNIKVPDTFWSPTKVEVNGETKEFPLSSTKHKVNLPNSEGFVYEAQGVRHCLKNGLKESPKVPFADSRSIFKVLQKVMDNIGLKYDGL